MDSIWGLDFKTFLNLPFPIGGTHSKLPNAGRRRPGGHCFLLPPAPPARRPSPPLFRIQSVQKKARGREKKWWEGGGGKSGRRRRRLLDPTNLLSPFEMHKRRRFGAILSPSRVKRRRRTDRRRRRSTSPSTSPYLNFKGTSPPAFPPFPPVAPSLSPSFLPLAAALLFIARSFRNLFLLPSVRRRHQVCMYHNGGKPYGTHIKDLNRISVLFTEQKIFLKIKNESIEIVVKISLSTKELEEDREWGQKVPPTKKAKVNRKASPPPSPASPSDQRRLRRWPSPFAYFMHAPSHSIPPPSPSSAQPPLTPLFPFALRVFATFPFPHQLPLLRSTSAAVATAGSRHYLGGGSDSGEGREGAGLQVMAEQPAGPRPRRLTPARPTDRQSTLLSHTH